MNVWERPDFERINITASVEVGEESYRELITAFAGFPRSRKTELHVEIEGATASGNRLIFSRLSISGHPTGEDNTFHCTVDLLYENGSMGAFQTRRRRTLERRFPTISAALEVLNQFGLECNFQCSMTWGFNIETISPIIQLPQLRINIPGTPLNQMVGVRFTSDNETNEDHVILDLITGSHWHLTSHSEVSRSWASDVIERLVEGADTVKESFVYRPIATGEEK